MKPAPFRYVRPATVAEAVAALREHGEDAKVLAGGQSLVPLLNMRLAPPAVVVDINRVAGLDRLSEVNNVVKCRELAVARFDRVEFVQHSNLTARHRRKKGDFVTVRDGGVEPRVVGVHRAGHRFPVRRHRREFHGQRLPHAGQCAAHGDLALELFGAGNLAKPGEQSNPHAHARRRASSRALRSSGSAVAPSIETSPPEKCSCFQIGTICFTRSMM